jgi:hypothetical protein
LDPFSVLAGAGGVLAVGAGLLGLARLLPLLRSPLPRAPVRGPIPLDLDQILGERLARVPTLPQIEELIAARVATLRADFNAIAESVDSNLDAIERTRKRVAARRSDAQPTDPQPPRGISPAALAYLQGRQ